MKKTVFVLIIFALIILGASCASQDLTKVESTNTSSESAPIELTTSNISDYLVIDGTYGTIERENQLRMSWGHSDFTISIYPSVPGDFYGVELVLKVKLTSGWDVSSDDAAFSDNDGYLTTTIKLPANGSKEETHKLGAVLSYGNHDNQAVKIEIVSVKGTYKSN